MKFIKGVIVGTVVSTGIAMMYNDNMITSRKKMIKKGKHLMKKIGII